MTKKCLGCGAVLQYKDILKDGYVKEENKDKAEYCERCFRINHYGDYKVVVKDNNEFLNIIDDINKTNDLVLLIVDLFNINNNYFEILNRLNNDILVVFTKRDLLPLSLKDNKLKDYIKELNINAVDSVIISSNKNYNLDELMNKIKKYKKGKNVYVIGFTNAGKSTLINKLLYNYSNQNPTITTSFLPSTTLSTIEIKFDQDLTFIDTPGILSEGNIIDYVDVKTLKNIIPKKEIKPITYQFKEKQVLMIEDLVYIEGQNTNITLFISNTLKINRRYHDLENNYNKQEIKVKTGEDIVLSGLGFIKCTKDTTITIYTKYPIKIFTRKSLI